MNYLEFPGKVSSRKTVTLFLHGFPGVRSVQNRDIAKAVSERTGRHCFVPLYSGLGFSEGTFSFGSCREEVREFTRQLLNKFQTIDVIGHSWGGYQALGLAAEHGAKIQKLILMSPLLHFFDLDLAARSFADTAKNNPQLRLGSTVERAAEFFKLGHETRAASLANRVSIETDVTILQAQDDDVTPAVYAKKLLKFFPSVPVFEMIDTDHSFLINRDLALQRIVGLL